MLEIALLFLALPLSGIFLGLLYEGLDRKITARMQSRIGPPIIQPFYDFLKLMYKENITPDSSIPKYYSFFTLTAFAASLVCVLLLPVAGYAFFSFTGDVIVLLYFLILSTISLALAGFSSTNPFSSVGSIRKVVLLIGYELPLILAVIAVAIASGSLTTANLKPGLLLPFAFLAYLLASQARISRAPFHIADAETELVAGFQTEFSGSLLALQRLTHAIDLFVMVSLGVALFFGNAGVFGFFAYSFLILFLLILLKVVTGRLRIDQSLNFFWFILTPLVLVDLIRALM